MDESISPHSKNTLKGIRLAARFTTGSWLGIGLIYTSMLIRLSQLVFCEVRILQLTIIIDCYFIAIISISSNEDSYPWIDRFCWWNSHQ